ncbi:MAG: hypothetical protein AAFP04_10715 [Myxococcota bacterium]
MNGVVLLASIQLIAGAQQNRSLDEFMAAHVQAGRARLATSDEIRRWEQGATEQMKKELIGPHLFSHRLDRNSWTILGDVKVPPNVRVFSKSFLIMPGGTLAIGKNQRANVYHMDGFRCEGTSCFYATYDMRAGLQPLIDAGKVRVATEADVEAWKTTALATRSEWKERPVEVRTNLRVDSRRTFIILENIQLPDGFQAWANGQFILAKGVQDPPLGNAAIYDMNDGSCSDRLSCLRVTLGQEVVFGVEEVQSDAHVVFALKCATPHRVEIIGGQHPPASLAPMQKFSLGECCQALEPTNDERAIRIEVYPRDPQEKAETPSNSAQQRSRRLRRMMRKRREATVTLRAHIEPAHRTLQRAYDACLAKYASSVGNALSR